MSIDPATPLRIMTKNVHITCAKCGRVTPILAETLRAGAGVVPTVGDLTRRLRCTACGAQGQVTLEVEGEPDSAPMGDAPATAPTKS
jgi:hypothetical protein